MWRGQCRMRSGTWCNSLWKSAMNRWYPLGINDEENIRHSSAEIDNHRLRTHITQEHWASTIRLSFIYSLRSLIRNVHLRAFPRNTIYLHKSVVTLAFHMLDTVPTTRKARIQDFRPLHSRHSIILTSCKQFSQPPL